MVSELASSETPSTEFLGTEVLCVALNVRRSHDWSQILVTIYPENDQAKTQEESFQNRMVVKSKHGEPTDNNKEPSASRSLTEGSRWTVWD